MSENKMSEIIRASIEGMRDFTSSGVSVGDVIVTSAGVTVIPVSKVSLGFAGGGVDFGQKKLATSQSFGSGSGSGVSITPLAFLTVGKNGEIDLIRINAEVNTSVERITSLIEHSPEIIQKIKDTFI